ncbi:hypothetical protein MAM1_0027d02204 [Mucor ambiguus]|uniref:Kelch repeat protein n=1 Tax=Mucor ambiguus TaxID=91626 RepID=A0A0C9MIA3_9FUNG|nr:hypothetical protein MAM1_0027d02204 [Mucor ambiguus]
MLMIRAVSLLTTVISAVVCAELISVSPYIGKHKASCDSHRKITGALVTGKIYTFGGCYAIPYTVDPDDETEKPSRNEDGHYNVTESSHVYDIASDIWSFEANTPLPLRGSSTLVVNKDIYFYNINAEPRISQLNLWKYSTDTKTWTELAELPFIKRGVLLTCHSNGKMYFMGSNDGYLRNIIHVHNLATNRWEDAIYLDKRITAREILCHDTHLSMIGDEENDKVDMYGFEGEKAFKQKLINVYHNGSVQVVEGFNVTLGYNIGGVRAQVIPANEWFYIFALSEAKNATEIVKINTLTLETIQLDAPPYALTDVLMLPTENSEVYLFGGGKEKIFGKVTSKEPNDQSLPKIKTYNHKITMRTLPTIVVEEKAEADEEEHRFKLQVPTNY